MPEIIQAKTKSLEEIKTKIKNIGKMNVEVPVSNQAMTLLKNLAWSETKWNHFIDWYIKNKVVVAGGHVLEYMERYCKEGDSE